MKINNSMLIPDVGFKLNLTHFVANSVRALVEKFSENFPLNYGLFEFKFILPPHTCVYLFQWKSFGVWYSSPTRINSFVVIILLPRSFKFKLYLVECSATTPQKTHAHIPISTFIYIDTLCFRMFAGKHIFCSWMANGNRKEKWIERMGKERCPYSRTYLYPIQYKLWE